ncbi:hypothetical protein [Bifidobacterium longum]|uniref:hypothetical protein n=1 Tax=Bifidobacterium longum TaxID=216816 RepID=UPI0018AB8891|nr:hypothetical protein [Bifidobacterium longum]MDB6881060.1 hypothetical protein [Bifidobacterium longum]MDB6887936.1 hypothetical protein [Bifidobacterium longum]MDB6891287.1 hypothetical protein [Bifidobacterium longum]
MSSEKPFWEGKTCEEMANLHVKVTFETGAVVTGITDGSGYIRRSSNGSGVPISPSRRAERFVPFRDIESIELVDDPECERIDDIDDVREGDIFVAKDGNHYPIKYIGDYGLGATFCVSLPYGIRAWLDDSAFSYALRPKPQLPDRDGLWFDKDGALWVARDGKARAICTSKGTWMANGPVDSQLRVFAPFCPAKAVEA